MAELNARIIAKASGTAGESPQAADLEVAEIAVNTADGKFFTKHTDGTIKEISGAGGGGGEGGINEIQEADDFALTQTSDKVVWTLRSTLNGSSPNRWQWVDGNTFRFSKTADDEDVTAYLRSWQVGDMMEFYNFNDLRLRYGRRITAITDLIDDVNVGGLEIQFTGAEIPEGEFTSIGVININRPVNPVDVPLAYDDLLKWDGNDFRNSKISLNELSDVTAPFTYAGNNSSQPYRGLSIDYLGAVFFNSYHRPEGQTWAAYATTDYGPAYGRFYNLPASGGTIEDDRERDDAARRTYYPEEGVLLNLGDKPLWLVGALGTYDDSTPEIRWTNGDPVNSSSDGNYIGLKLPTGLTSDVTYTFPSEVESGNYLQVDATGNLKWNKPSSLTPGLTYMPEWFFNYENDGNDYQAIDSALLSTADPKIGTSSLKINAVATDAQTVQGVWPTKNPYGDFDFIGTRPFTFETWFQNLNPDRPGDLSRYHRIISAASADTSVANQANGFQVRTWGGSTTSDGPQGAIELSADTLIIRGSTVVTDQDWHHLVIQHDGNGNYWMFLDGVLDKFNTLETPYTFLNLDGWILGGRNDSAANTYWMGQLDATQMIIGTAKYPAEGFTPPTAPAGSEPVVIVEQTQARLAVISDLSDVDTVTTPPTNGQALVWDQSGGAWVPGSVASGGSGALASVRDWTIQGASPSTASMSLDTPSTSEGDLLVACIMHRSTGGTLTPPSGWTLHGTYLSNVEFDGTTQTISVFTRTATSSEPATYAWTQAVSSRMCGFIVSADGASSIDSVVEVYGNGPTAEATTPGGALSITAATWIYASDTEAYSQSGDGLYEISDSPQEQARISGGYTIQGTVVTSEHSASDTGFNPNHGIIVITLLSSGSGGSGGGSYVLPAATASTLGGIKVGSGLNVTGDGTLSAPAPPAAPVSSVAGKTGDVTLEMDDIDGFSLNAGNTHNGNDTQEIQLESFSGFRWNPSFNENSSLSYLVYNSDIEGLIIGQSGGNSNRLYMGEDHISFRSKDGVGIASVSIQNGYNSQSISGLQTELRLYSGGDPYNGGKYVALRSPLNPSSTTTMTFPGNSGSNGQVLSTNGSGTLSWIDNETITLASLKSVVAASTDFADFQSRIATL